VQVGAYNKGGGKGRRELEKRRGVASEGGVGVGRGNKRRKFSLETEGEKKGGEPSPARGGCGGGELSSREGKKRGKGEDSADVEAGEKGGFENLI